MVRRRPVVQGLGRVVSSVVDVAELGATKLRSVSVMRTGTGSKLVLIFFGGLCASLGGGLLTVMASPRPGRVVSDADRIVISIFAGSMFVMVAICVVGYVLLSELQSQTRLVAGPVLPRNYGKPPKGVGEPSKRPPPEELRVGRGDSWS